MIRQLPAVSQADTAAGTANSTFPVFGVLEGMYVAFDSAGTLTVSVPTQNATLLTLTSAGTQWYYPRVQVHNTSGSALTLDGTRTLMDKIPLADYVRVVINAAGTAAVTLLVSA